MRMNEDRHTQGAVSTTITCSKRDRSPSKSRKIPLASRQVCGAASTWRGCPPLVHTEPPFGLQGPGLWKAICPRLRKLLIQQDHSWMSVPETSHRTKGNPHRVPRVQSLEGQGFGRSPRCPSLGKWMRKTRWILTMESVHS